MRDLLIVTQRTLHTAPRVIREIEALQADFKIHTIGITAPKQTVQSHMHSAFLKESTAFKAFRKLRRVLLNRYIARTHIQKSKLRRVEKLLHDIKPAIVICHECFDVPYFAALKEKYGFKLVFNAHEYYPLEFDERPDWASTWQLYYEDLYRQILPHVDLLVNVCDSIREKCLEVFQKDSLVIPNASFYDACEASPVHQPLQLIHHGGAIPSRKIEEMIAMMGLLGPQYELSLMLMPSVPDYFEQLKAQAAGMPNVRFIETVPFHQIVKTLNQYDLGIYILPPSSFNNAIALPNKLYEFIQAKLAVAIGPSPEMARVVREHQVGMVANDFSAKALADMIRTQTPTQWATFKANAEQAAQKLSAEQYHHIFKDHILALLEQVRFR
ncbi:MAG: glycosyltransferase [Chitinophagaceae bacterium]